jgi:biotin transport system permease protein
MAELSAFGFRPGDSLLHRIDPRFKLGSLMLLSLAALHGQVVPLSLITVPLLWLGCRSRLPLKGAAAELRYFSILLLAVFAARALWTPGTPLVGVWGVAVTRQGVADGILVCWRLAVVILAGLLLTSTTRHGDLRAGIQMLLQPLPRIPHQRIATTMGLILRFIPMIFHQAAETAMAQKSRGVENRRNPIYRLTCFVLPLLRGTVGRADDLALAMAARGYTEDRTGPELVVRPRDWLALWVCASLLILSLWG